MSFKNNKINIILFALVCIAMLLSFSSVYAEGNNVTSDISCVEMDNSVKEVYCFSIEDSTDILSSIDNNTSDRLYTKTNNENQESILKTSDLDSLQVSSNRVVLNNNFNMDDYINQSLRSPTGPFVVSSSGHGYATLVDAIGACGDDVITVVESGSYSGTGNVGVNIDKNVVVKAGSGCEVIFDADGLDSNILTIASDKNVALVNLVFTGVKNTNTRFGAVVNHGILSVKGCTFKKNLVLVNGVGGSDGAAAIFSDGSALVIDNSSFLDNVAKPVAPTSHIPSGGIAAVSSGASNGVSIFNSVFVNNTARYGAAVEFEKLNQEEAVVVNCSFINNTGYIGAGVDINDDCVYVNITSSIFISNRVLGPQGASTTGAMGGAICAGSSTNPVVVEISDSLFKNNTGDGSVGSAGGAIRLANKASGIIDNCSFISNKGNQGSAISTGTIYEDAASLVIVDSVFMENEAFIVGTVVIGDGVSANIKNSVFLGNVAPRDWNIYKGGFDEVVITGSTFDILVTFDDDVSADVIYGNGKSFKVYVDDGAGKLNDNNIVLSLDGFNLVAVPVVVLDDGKMGAVINLGRDLNVGTHNIAIVSVNSDVNSYIVNGDRVIFNVIKADVNIGVVGDTVIYLENGCIKITSDVDGYYTVRINNVDTIIKVVGGNANFDVSNLDVDIYDVKITFEGNENYNTNDKVFVGAYVVNKADVTLTIYVSNINVGDEEFILVTVPNEVTGTVNITVNNTSYDNIAIVDGKVCLSIVNLISGKYSVKAVYNGNNNYLPSNVTNATFTVSKIISYLINASSDNIIEGQMQL